MKVTPEALLMAAIIAYVAFFTRPPPKFVALVLAHPVGQVLVLLGVVAAFMKNQPIGLLLGVAYLTSSYPVLEYLDASEQKPASKQKEQPKSGAPKIDLKDIGKLAGLIGGKGGKLKQEQGKSETAPPPSTNKVKPHSDTKVTEKYMNF
jgi:hypothetical protein